MNPIDIMKLKGVRLSYNNRWLIYYDGRWTVMEHKYNQKKVTQIIETDNLSKALNELIGE